MFFIEQKDFLSQQEKWDIESVFWSDKNAWVYQPITISELHVPGVVDLGAGYDISYFTYEPDPNSEQYKMIAPMVFKFLELNKINHLDILRIKLNITPSHDEISQSPPHSDKKTPHLNFIYYVNDCEGDTVLYNEFSDYKTQVTNPTVFKKITPESGKAILFDGRQFHAITPPSKMPLRGVINALIKIEDWPAI